MESRDELRSLPRHENRTSIPHPALSPRRTRGEGGLWPGEECFGEFDGFRRLCFHITPALEIDGLHIKRGASKPNSYQFNCVGEMQWSQYSTFLASLVVR